MPRLLLSIPEVAQRIGVTSRRVHTMTKATPGFPEAYAVTEHGQRLWRPEDVDRWAATADRRAGRRWAQKH